eukprot:jgi/Ulvmu1/12173/UM085_0037.1
MNMAALKSGCAAPRRSRVVNTALPSMPRRDVLVATTTAIGLCTSNNAIAAEPKPKKPVGPITSALCDVDCVAALPDRVKLPSGLEYVDIVPGTGVKPITGYQITVNYVAMNTEGRAFDSSIDKGAPYDIRYGVGAVIPGLDEGLKTMKTGGVRRLYIPGELAFPKGLPAAAGRPRVPPASPVIFDVQLLYIPGFGDEDE